MLFVRRLGEGCFLISFAPAVTLLMAASKASGGQWESPKMHGGGLAVLYIPYGVGWLPQFFQCRMPCPCLSHPQGVLQEAGWPFYPPLLQFQVWPQASHTRNVNRLELYQHTWHPGPCHQTTWHSPALPAPPGSLLQTVHQPHQGTTQPPAPPIQDTRPSQIGVPAGLGSPGQPPESHLTTPQSSGPHNI